jgi:hypothetical protein
MPTDLTTIPAEIVGAVTTYQWWTDPFVWQGVGAFVFLLLLVIGYVKFPKAYKLVWTWMKTCGRRVQRFLLMMITFVAVVAFVGVYFSVSIESFQSVSPELYGLAAPYTRVFYLVFWGLIVLTYGLRSISYGDREENGVIEDIDTEKRLNITDTRVDQMQFDHRKEMNQMNENHRKEMEEMREYHRKNEEKHEKAIEKLTQMVIDAQQAFYARGTRFEENPVPPVGMEERRTIVKVDPSIPPSKESIVAAVPELASPKEEIILPENEAVMEESSGGVSSIQDFPKEEIPEALPEKPAIAEKSPEHKPSWKHASDWDELILGKFGKH